MSDNNNNNNNDLNNIRTDSYLPLLFANGYPTSLEKMSREALELFIPFLVRCARYGGNENSDSTPVWWPGTVEFKTPLEKPKHYKKNWQNELRRIVEKCYEYHQQPFLLKYSRDLCEHEPANLRYVTASDSTTSLYSRRPKRLLLTFRNENMLYDKKKRMTLWKKDENVSPSSEHDANVTTFDIMLCDNCDAEFYSEEAFSKHEKKCGNAQATADLLIVDNIVISDDEEEDEVEEISGNGQTDFMAYFFLKSSNSDEIPKRNNSLLERSLSPKKKKKPNQRTRHVTNKKEKDLERLIPFSSPGGVVLTKKAIVSEEYVQECLEEIEQYCPAKPNTKIHPRSRQRLQIVPETAVTKEMRKPRHYYWPKRTLHSQSRENNFEFLNRPLIKAMRDCTVEVYKFSAEEIGSYQENLERVCKETEQARISECVNLISDSDEETFTPECNVNVQPSDPYEGRFLSTLYKEPYVMPLSTIPKISFPEPEIPFNNDHFTPYQNESTSSTHIFQQFAFTSTSTANMNPGKRRRENDDSENRVEKRSIQNWIQNVNGENFNNANQGTFTYTV